MSPSAERLLDRYEGRAPVDIEADLTLTVESQPITVESYTDLVHVDLPSLRVCLTVLRTDRIGEYAVRVDGLLRTLDLTADVAVAGVRIARLGTDARPPVGRFPVEPDYTGLARALLRAPIRFFS